VGLRPGRDGLEKDKSLVPVRKQTIFSVSQLLPSSLNLEGCVLSKHCCPHALAQNIDLPISELYFYMLSLLLL